MSEHYEDPVVAEIHAIRAQMLAECGGDHHKLMEQVRERERASGREVIPVPAVTPVAHIRSPRLVHPEQASDFVTEVIDLEERAADENP
jgi:hypothetical protein